MTSSGHFSAIGPAAYWYPVAWSTSIRAKPVATRLFNTPLVLFRDAAGQACALLDRCPHRNTPLSLGRCVSGELECAYHGWRFSGDGTCTTIPSLLNHKPKSSPARHATRFACLESQGLVWVWIKGEPGSAQPYSIPGLDDARYVQIRYDACFDATLYATAENILDVPHTAFLHRGLFRGSSRRKRVTVQVRRGSDRAEARFEGEERPSGLIGAVLAPQGGSLEHVDRFIMPGIAQVEYRLGERSHVVVTNLLSPRSDFETAMFTVATLRLPIGTRLVRRLAEPLARRIVAQDAEILAALTRTTREFGGERFASTELDVLGSSILKLLRWGEQGSSPAVPDEVRAIEMEI